MHCGAAQRDSWLRAAGRACRNVARAAAGGRV